MTIQHASDPRAPTASMLKTHCVGLDALIDSSSSTSDILFSAFSPFRWLKAGIRDGRFLDFWEIMKIPLVDRHGIVV